jgi:hypothetical protein
VQLLQTLKKIILKAGSSIKFNSNSMVFLAISVGIVATWVAVFFAGQPLLEWEAFRQTQTALTSYWMIQEGWQLPYQTPVLGYPWAVPFEFPIYQSIVALIAWLGNFPLDPVGRLVSFCFLLACAWPAFAILRRLNLPADVGWTFCALLWSSPLYLFYGRTFLMETAALFFSLAAIPYALDLRDHHPRWRSAVLFAIFATLGMLQKITTGFPVVAVMGFVLLTPRLRPLGLRVSSWRQGGYIAVALSVPIVAGLLWTSYAGSVRAQNRAGAGTTFGEQSAYYLGSLDQRLNLDLLKTIFWDRIIEPNAAGVLGLMLICGALLLGDRPTRLIVSISLVLFALPIFLFFNVHYFLEYYQTSSALFLLAALAVACSLWLPRFAGWYSAAPLVGVILVGANLFHFFVRYGPLLRKEIDVTHTRTLAVSDVISRYTPLDSGILVFGLPTKDGPAYPVISWSSEVAYYSQRKALTVEEGSEESFGDNPASFLGGKALGAIVFCSRDNIQRHRGLYERIIDRYAVDSRPGLFQVNDCYVWLPEAKLIELPNEGPTSPVQSFN